MKWTVHKTPENLNHLGTYLIAIIAMIFWGMSFIWSTIVFKYYDPLTTIFLRLVLSTLVLIIFYRLFSKPEKIRKKDYGLFLLSAIFNPFIYFLGENFGLKLTTPTVSAIIIATIPVFIPIAAYLLLKERVALVNIAGILLSFAGILIMLVRPDMTIEVSLPGIGLLMIAVFAAVIYTILIKKLVTWYRPVTIITVQNLLGMIFFLPLFLIFSYDDFIKVKPNFELISSLLQLAIFASSLAFILFTRVIRNIGISRASVFSNLIPVITAVFSFILVSETFSINKISGMVVIMSGILITQWRRGKPNYKKN